MGGLVHVVLDQHLVFEDGDLGPVLLLPDDHDPVNRLAPGQELRLGDDRRPAAAGFPALAAALPLRFQPGGSAYRLDVAGRDGLVGGVRARHPHVHHGVRRVIGGWLIAFGGRATAAPAAPAAAAAIGTVVRRVLGGVAVIGLGRGLPAVRGGAVTRLGLALLALALLGSGPAAAAAGGRLAGLPVRGLARAVLAGHLAVGIVVPGAATAAAAAPG